MKLSKAAIFLIVLLVSLGAAAWWLAGARSNQTVSAEIVRLNNEAVGLMGQFDFDAAVRAFDALAAAAPQWPGARLNLAIALVNRQGPDDAARAEALLRELLDVEPVARRARYTLGLLLTHEGRDDEALPLMTGVADGEPPDGFAAYFAGQLRLTGDPAAALDYYRRAVAREPLLRSAFYGAFLALRRLQREDEAARMLAEFQALDRHPQALVAEFKYTRMGPLSEVVTVDAAASPTAVESAGPRFLAPRELAGGTEASWRAGGSPRSITLADIDGDGALDVFIADALTGPAPNAVLFGRGNRFELDLSHPLAEVPDVRAALWGDLDDDGRADVVLCRPSGATAIWRPDPNGVWRDTTAQSGVTLPGAEMVDGAVFDADHDGDLDVWLVNAAGPNELLSNDGGGRFRAIGASADIAGDGRPSRGMAVADLDGDRDADVIVLKATPPHDVYLNGRVWEYRRDDAAADLAAAPVSALVPGDVDADGEIELYTAGPRGLERWRRDDARVWRAERLSATVDADARLAMADTDGDGRLELLATSGGSWVAFEAASAASGWTQAASGGEDAGVPGGWAVAQLDAATGPSVVGVDGDGVPHIWAPGPGRGGFLGLSFTGRDPASDQRRSNVSGLGTRVTLRVGSRWTAVDNTRLASGPGQSLQPVTIGVGDAARADFVALTWSDGVFQTELALDAGRLHRIAETQRQLSSCPVLFAWDGTSFQFVTDLLGTGGIGFFERPGAYAEPLPRENVLLPAAMASSDGVYRLKIAEPMEEITYLDSLALVAYDLPPGWQMALDERKAVSGPVPTGEPIFYREERRPIDVRGASGDDVTGALAEADLRAAGPAAVDPRFIGRAEPWSITMTFAESIDRGPGRPVLIVDGWVEYPYAQTMFAAWQAGAAYEAPTLEARGADGGWREVAREFGYPAGMPRRMAFPMPALPRGTTALRLRTSQEIYWDRVSVAYAEPAPGVVRRVLTMREAVLEADGFARRTTGPQRAPHYDDSRRQPLGDTRHPRGWYTAFGRVDPLVADEDAAVAILGPGEALTVAYEAPGDAPAEGWTRRLVLEARGWCKDMDLYTRDGETVEPLPGANTPARARLHPLFNTRYASGF